jgi:hypothetical protein
MNAPLTGTWTAHLQAIRPFNIHGDPYYELYITKDDQPDQVLALRVAKHAIQSPILQGDTITLTFLMGQVTNVTKA